MQQHPRRQGAPRARSRRTPVLAAALALALVAAAPSGRALGAPAPVAPLPGPAIGFLYVNGGGTIAAYAVDSAGNLDPISGSPYATGQPAAGGCCALQTLAYDSSRSVLYAANPGASSVSAFALDRATGALTQVSGSPFATTTSPAPGEASPSSVVVDKTGSYLYAGRGYGSGGAGIDGFSIGADGALTRLTGSPFGIGSGASGFVLAHDRANNTILSGTNGADLTVFSIGAGGALTALSGSPYAGKAKGSQALALHPSRPELALGDATSAEARGFALLSGGGVGTQTAGQAGPGAGVRFTSAGDRLYGVGLLDGKLYGYAASSGPSFTPLAWSPADLGFGALNVTTSSSGALVFAAGGGVVRSYTLTGSGGAPVQAAAASYESAYGGDGLLYVAPGGFDSQFNGSGPMPSGWTVVTGTAWSEGGGLLSSTSGVAGKIDSVTRAETYTGAFQYEASMARTGATGAATTLWVHGTPTPVQTSTNRWNTGYAFQISISGKYSVFRMSGGSVTTLQNWTTSANIAAGSSGPNVVRVVADGAGNYALYVNDMVTPVWTGSDVTFTSGQIGLGLARTTTTTDRLDVDWARLGQVGSFKAGLGRVSAAQEALNREANRHPKGSFEQAP